MSSKHQISYELPSSTTASDDIQEVENAEKRFRRPTTPLDSSEAEAAPSADREGRSSPSSYSLSCTASSGDISRVSDEFDSCSWSLKFHESKEVENGDPNESGNKHPPRLETPPFRPPSPFEIEMEEDSMDVPPNPGEHIQLSRAETDAIIDRLLSSCDGDFGDEFDDDFDPAVIKFEIEPEVKQPRVEGPITLYSEDEDESDNETKKPFKSQPIVVIDDDSDDEEVKIICSRQNANEVSVDRSVSRNELTSGRSMMGLGKRSILDDVEEENDVIFVPPAATKSCADTTTYFGDPGPSTSSGSRGGSVARHISRPSTSRAALKHTTAVRPTAPIPIKPEPTHSTTTMNDDISRSSHMTDYRIAFAEVEQLLTEDNERNRRFFSAPSPPPPDRGMFKKLKKLMKTWSRIIKINRSYPPPSSEN